MITTNSNKDRKDKPPRKKVEEIAKEYTPGISKLLNFKIASTEEIKTGIEAVRGLVNWPNRRDIMSYHQIRNIFKLLKNANSINDLNLKRPRLAYVGARVKEEHGKVIATVIDELIIQITNETDTEKQTSMLKGLDYILESIVAYHKFYHGEK